MNADIALIPMELGHIRALRRSDSQFSAEYGFEVESGWLMDQAQVLEFFEENFESFSEDWPMFLLVDSPAKKLIGGIGYKGSPHQSQVEIGYGIAPTYQNRGIATWAVQRLVKFAFESGEVTSVIAHTLIGENASSRVLTKAGFNVIGEVNDPDDGPVWRWQVLIS